MLCIFCVWGSRQIVLGVLSVFSIPLYKLLQRVTVFQVLIVKNDQWEGNPDLTIGRINYDPLIVQLFVKLHLYTDADDKKTNTTTNQATGVVMMQNQTDSMWRRVRGSRWRRREITKKSSSFGVAWDTFLIGAEDVWGIIIVLQVGAVKFHRSEKFCLYYAL